MGLRFNYVEKEKEIVLKLNLNDLVSPWVFQGRIRKAIRMKERNETFRGD